MRRTWWHIHRVPQFPTQATPSAQSIRRVGSAPVGRDHTSELAVEPILASVAKARAVIQRSLQSVSTDRAERATACGSELVANAVCHGSPPILLTVINDADRIVVTVEDGSRQPPTPRTAGISDHNGRGTLIVDKLADQWGVDFLPHGKRVWCLITLPH
jgi:anti-sigma regulatory factor (Ser/Thr protein kinase)